MIHSQKQFAREMFTVDKDGRKITQVHRRQYSYDINSFLSCDVTFEWNVKNTQRQSLICLKQKKIKNLKYLNNLCNRIEDLKYKSDNIKTTFIDVITLFVQTFRIIHFFLIFKTTHVNETIRKLP